MNKNNFVKGFALIIAVTLIFVGVVPGTLALLLRMTPAIYNYFNIVENLPPDDPDLPPIPPPEQGYGNLTVNKVLEHPFGQEYKYPENLKFDFEIDFGEEFANKSFASTGGLITADNKGVLSIRITPDCSYTIQNIPLETVLTVTELQKGAPGFSIKSEAEREITITEEKNSVVFINTYSPAAYDFDGPLGVELIGSKTLTGRDWQDGDSFTFILEMLVGNQWVNMGTQTVTYDPQNPDFNKFDFDKVLKNIVITETGKYFFRVTEELGNIDRVNYDQTVNYFELTITDVDMDGALELLSQNIITHQNISLSVNNETLKRELNVTFNNAYEPPPVPADINIHVTANNVIIGDSDGVLSADMFQFVLENADTGIETVLTSAKNGKTVFGISFSADDIGKTAHYKMYQLDNGIENVIYSDVVYDIYVTITLGEDNKLIATVICSGVEYANFVGEFETIYVKPQVDPPVIIDPPVEPDKFYIWPIIVDAAVALSIAIGWTVAHIVHKIKERKEADKQQGE